MDTVSQPVVLISGSSEDLERRLVQCKRWAAASVNVDEVRKLAGTLPAEGLPGSARTLVTSSDFTKAAIDAAKQFKLEIIDGAALVERQAAGADKLLGPF